MKTANKISALLLSLAIAAMAQYSSGPVANGGSISGVVKTKGKPPADEEKIVHKNAETCGAKIAAQKYVVSAAGEVEWAVVSLDGITAGKKMDAPTDLVFTNTNCHFVPHVLVAPMGANLKVRNDDDMLHNSHFYLVEGATKKNLINMALPKKGQIIENAKILRKDGLVAVNCDAHDFMQGYIFVSPTPYAVVTDAKGSFKMTDVPVGTYKLKVWHEGLGEKTVSVTVVAGKDAKVSVEL